MLKKVFCLAVFLAVAPGLWAAEAEKSVPVQVHGDSVEYFHEDQRVEATGNVSIDYEDVNLKADKMTVYTGKKLAVAEGNVVLTQGGSVFKGKRGEYDFGKKIGNVSELDATIPPNYYGKAKQIERVSDTHYRAIDSYITTCCGDNPFYKVQAHQIDIYPGQKVVARNAVLFIRGLPVMFVPYFETRYADFQRFPVQLVPGTSSEWGPFLLSKWRYHLLDTPAISTKGNVQLDYRAKKGLGGGIENFYHGDKVGHGAIRAYYANDNHPPENFGEDRHRVQWRHQSKVAPSTTLTAEITKLSDPLVVKDYFYREEYERQAVPDNYVSLITAKPEWTMSVLARERVDDFFTVVEREPQVRFDTYNKPLFDTPFYFRQEVQYDNLKKEFANATEDFETQRLDTNHTLSYAGHIGQYSVTPRVGTHQTFYTHGNRTNESFERGTLDPGLDVSTRFYKTYDWYLNAAGLDYNQIRHIFTPTASYNFRPNPTTSRSKLQQFDALDSLDKQNFVRFQFENKLQTRQHDANKELYTREIARIVPFFDQDFDTGALQNIGYDMELKPYTWLGIESDATYLREEREFETVNADLYFEKNNMRFSLGQRYLREESSQTTAQIKWKYSPEWEFKVYERFEFETADSKEFELEASRTFECVILDMIYNNKVNEGSSVYFALRLKAFPRASFGLSQSYNSPKTSRL